MNQHSIQSAKYTIQRDFFKLLKNANFGYACRNNLDNCKCIPIFDKLSEITYLKKYYNFFNPDISKFVSSELLEKETDENFKDEIIKIQQNDPFCRIKTALNNKRKEDLEAIDAFKKRQRRLKCKRSTKYYMRRYNKVQKK